jgi:branched-chain amino acid transport system permease protein
MLGGFIMGFVETFAKAYISGRWADAIVFGILIVVLSVKPTGILGKNVREKV